MEIISLIIFIFTAAMAAGSILLLSRLIAEHSASFIRSLYYHTIFISAFGFYGIWGQFIIIAMAGSRIDPALLSSITVISLLLGLPFLVFGWMMLIRFSAEAAGYQIRHYFTMTFLLINFGIIAALVLIIKDMEFSVALPLLKYYYAAAAILFSLISALLLVKGNSASPGSRDRIYLAVIIAAGAVAQAMILLFIPHSVWMALIFVFLLFTNITLLPLYLTYQADLSSCSPADPLQLPHSIEDFFRTHEISPREAEIIEEICRGLSNQEIANKLFISLQTVKDHTSRIYTKANLRNRMQLMALVRDMDALREKPGTV